MRSFIELDLTVLEELGDGYSISDLDLGDTVDIINDPEEVIVRIVQTSAARRDESALGEEGEAVEGEEGEESEGEEE